MICCVIGDWSIPTAFLNIIVNYFESTPVGHGGPAGSGTLFRSWSPCFFFQMTQRLQTRIPNKVCGCYSVPFLMFSNFN